MWSLPPSVRIFVCLAPTDLRRSFDGLAGMVAGVLSEDPLSGHLFVFRNRRADLIKILYWDRSGYCIWAKRLERGTFRFPQLKADLYPYLWALLRCINMQYSFLNSSVLYNQGATQGERTHTIRTDAKCLGETRLRERGPGRQAAHTTIG